MEALRAFLFGEEGQSLIEFALLFLYIAVVAAIALPGVRRRILWMRMSREIAR
jgi:Flp pilus assembly pilin Flp